MIQQAKPSEAPEGAKLDVVVPPAAEAVDATAVPADVPAIAVGIKYAAMLEGGKFSKRPVLDGIVSFLEREAVDEIDRKTINSALGFIENPTENLDEIAKHAQRILEVSSGYDQQGLDAPVEIDALAGYLLALECVSRMLFIEGEIARGVPDSPEVEAAIVLGVDQAKTLSKAYGGEAILTATIELRSRLPIELMARIDAKMEARRVFLEGKRAAAAAARELAKAEGK